MTITQETTIDATSTTDQATEAQSGTAGNGGSDAEDAPRGNREARYRVERNEARTALAAVEARIAELQTREVERLAGESLSQPADLLSLGGIGLADLLDEAGNVDSAAVADAAAELIASRPGLAKNFRVPAVDHTQGQGSDSPGKSGPSWGDLFRS